MKGNRSSTLHIWNVCLGNVFEHYDTALFSFLAPFLSPFLFPDKEPTIALILTYAIIPLGTVARPLGSLVFGYIGDVYGRVQALFLTFVGMAIISGFIACVPVGMQFGILSPVLFFLGRALQNFLSAGQTMGGAIFVLEQVDKKRTDLLSGIYSACALGGHLLASFGIFLLSHYNQVLFGWRFLYLLGCITALFGWVMHRYRYYVTSIEPVYHQKTQKFFDSVIHLKKNIWTYRKPFLSIMISAGFARASYSIALVLMNGWIPLVSSLTKTELMRMNTYLLLFDFCILPLFGWLSSKTLREKVMLLSSLSVVVFSMPLLTLLQGGSIGKVIVIRMIFVIFGVAFFAPFHAWAQQLVPSNARYAIISFGYAMGSQLLGSPTAALALGLFHKTGMVSSIAWYWMSLGLASGLSIIWQTKKTQNVDYKKQAL